MRAILVQEDAHQLPPSVTGALTHAEWDISMTSGYAEALDQTRHGEVDAIFLTGTQHTSQVSSQTTTWNQLLRLADSKQIATLIFIAPDETPPF